MKVLTCLLAISPFIVLAAKADDQSAADAFYKAIRTNDLKSLKALIDADGVKVVDSKGNSPLMYASLSGSVDAVDLLIKAGADVNHANGGGITALMWCPGSYAKTKLLLEHGADAAAASKDRHTALELASSVPHNAKTVELLLQKGAKATFADKQLMTPLEYAAGNNLLDTAKLLVEHGADVNAADATGVTPLFAAASSGYNSEAMIRFLLKHGAKANVATGKPVAQVQNGIVQLGFLTPLQIAAVDSYGASKALIEAGADVTAKDCRGQDALTFATATDHADPRTVKMLMEKGGDSKRALEWATAYNNAVVLKQFGARAVDPESHPAPLKAAMITPDFVKASVVKAVGVCQDASKDFLKKGGCVSCHSQIATGFAAFKSANCGVPIDLSPSMQAAGITAGFLTGIQEDCTMLSDPGGTYHTLANALLTIRGAKIPASIATDSVVHYLLCEQSPEGTWPLAGEVRPPFEDGEFNATADCILALKSYPVPARQAEIDVAVSRAASWMRKAKPVTLDDRANQILGLLWAGQSVPERMVSDLIRKQRPNGGWGQTDGLASDAYATGLALVALHEAGVSATNDCYKRGVQFLLQTQGKDGTWHVATRSFKFQPYFESGFPYGPDQWISQHGTAYAAAALATALPELK